jgi:hypothetical protein
MQGLQEATRKKKMQGLMKNAVLDDDGCVNAMMRRAL